MHWPQQPGFISSAAAQHKIKPTEIFVGILHYMTTQIHQVFCLCNKSCKGFSIKLVDRRLCCSPIVYLYNLPSMGNMFCIFFSSEPETKLQLDVFGSICLAWHCVTCDGTVAHQ